MIKGINSDTEIIIQADTCITVDNIDWHTQLFPTWDSAYGRHRSIFVTLCKVYRQWEESQSLRPLLSTTRKSTVLILNLYLYLLLTTWKSDPKYKLNEIIAESLHVVVVALLYMWPLIYYDKQPTY